MNRTIKSTINQKKELLDRNSHNYLILELTSGESILVFPGKVNPEKWPSLQEGQTITFTIEEGKNGANILVDYELEVK